MAHAVPSTARPFRHAGTRHRASAGPPMWIFFPFHNLVVLPRLLPVWTARTHARTQIKERRKEKKYNNDSATCIACTAPRNRVHQCAMACCRLAITDWLAAGWAGLNLPKKKKNKRDSPIPQPRFCNTHPLHSRRHGAAQLPNPLCRRSLSQISEAFFQKCFFVVVVCRRCRVPTLPYLTLPPR